MGRKEFPRVLGKQTDEVLAELDDDPQKMATVHKAGVVGDR